jgi:phosphatidate cytidylyltransferase
VSTDAVPGPAVPASRRGPGRDLPAAVAVSLVLATLVLGCLFVVKDAFVVLTAAAIVVALWELTRALGTHGVRVPLVPLLLGAPAMLAGAYLSGPRLQLLALSLCALALVAWRLASPVAGYARDVSSGVLAALYLPFLAGFALLLLRPEDGPWRVVTFIVVTVSSDIGGYAVGVVLGRHPMAPTVSPKKSWEGFAGSLGACVLAGSLLVSLALDGPWWAGALLGLAAVTTATLGDLGESLLKRDLGIKDMGSLLPGHGGIMDRLDSLLPTAPVAWLLLTAMVPVAAG